MATTSQPNSAAFATTSSTEWAPSENRVCTCVSALSHTPCPCLSAWRTNRAARGVAWAAASPSARVAEARIRARAPDLDGLRDRSDDVRPKRVRGPQGESLPERDRALEAGVLRALVRHPLARHQRVLPVERMR